MMRYPGNGAFYVLCDVCGFKIRARDAIRITDKYNTLNGMVVCKKDADEANPQQRVRSRKEKQIRDVKHIRSEGIDTYQFVSDPSAIDSNESSAIGSRLPTAPQNLTVYTATAALTELVWLPPLEPGSGPIVGYKIERESPVGGGFSTLVITTVASGYYKDTTTIASTQYNYRVSAYSDVGLGTVSNSVQVTPS